MNPPAILPAPAASLSPAAKAAAYRDLLNRLESLLAGETDEIAALSTVVCELYHGFETFDWVGFYRVVAPGILKVGPYQGTHGCLTIPFSRGVCGRCAREARTQRVDDVTQAPHHIACSGSTRSEVVVPVFDPGGTVRAVLDIDSDALAAFDATDEMELEGLCRRIGRLYSPMRKPAP